MENGWGEGRRGREWGVVMARVEILSCLVENIVGETPSCLVEIVFSLKNETL